MTFSVRRDIPKALWLVVVVVVVVVFAALHITVTF